MNSTTTRTPVNVDQKVGLYSCSSQGVKSHRSCKLKLQGNKFSRPRLINRAECIFAVEGQSGLVRLKVLRTPGTHRFETGYFDRHLMR